MRYASGVSVTCLNCLGVRMCLPLDLSRITWYRMEVQNQGSCMVKFSANTLRRGRVLLYALVFLGLFALDTVTPLGIADWLLDVIVVGVASVWGTRRELRVVLAIACAAVLIGLWASPVTVVPFWMGTLNRLAAILVMCSMAYLADRRRLAEEARRKAVSELKFLQGLLPICAACKAINSAAGEWQSLESYLSANSEAQLTHGPCPPCAAKYMAELSDEMTDL
jgi:hypothetical protein